MVDQHFHQVLVDPGDAKVLGQQQEKPAQNRDRHHAFSNQGDLLPKRVCQQNRTRQEPELDDDVPESVVCRRIIHSVFLLPDFQIFAEICSGGRADFIVVSL